MSGTCTVCRQEFAKTCGGCGLDFYCSKEHQVEDWPRHKAMVCQAPPQLKTLLKRRRAEMDVNDEAMAGRNGSVREKERCIRTVNEYGVRRLLTVICNNDTDWATKLLIAASPLVEELEVWNVDPEQWLQLQAMPRLYRLEVNTYVFSIRSLPELADRGDEPGGLLWVRTCLDEEATESLLRAHSRTLREVQLFVGTKTHSIQDPLVPTEPRWPWTCSAADLTALVSRCGLRELRRLVLRRPHRPVWTLSGDFCHRAAECRQQLHALRGLFPHAKVLCGTCHNVTWKCFGETIFGEW